MVLLVIWVHVKFCFDFIASMEFLESGLWICLSI
jgi:hypothetical protein